MILDRVTVTGADDSIEPSDLIPLTRLYPFVEWGILLSRSQEGAPRFPSLDWIRKLQTLSLFPELRLSGHLCGAWVRDFCRGIPQFWVDRPTIAWRFDRIQLNLHAQLHEIRYEPFVTGLRICEPRDGWIFQLDAVNDEILARVRDADVKAAGLFDRSGGAGVLPSAWPETQDYAGYAGGLSPENLEAQLTQMDRVAQGRVWIDVETHVRSDNDRRFDLERVEKFLEVAWRWTTR